MNAPLRSVGAGGAVIAILGAESTGKTTLAQALAAALAASSTGASVAVVPETLREFCDREQRTPRQDEQVALAAEHTRRIEAATRTHDWVIADTTALQTAVYSEQVFGDRSLYEEALAWQRERVALTLLTALDLPWEADGLQRDGPHVREPVDRLLRGALQRAGVGYAVVHGAGDMRTQQALAAWRRAATPPAPPAAGRWQWRCERCSDGGCERHWLRQLLAREGVPL